TLDGLAATRLLRRLGCALPIVALTARTAPGDVDDCLAAGCDAFSPKPIDAEVLLALVRELVHNGSRRGASNGADAPSSSPRESRTGTTPVPFGIEANAADALHSDFADDPDMAELIDAFVGNLPPHGREHRGRARVESPGRARPARASGPGRGRKLRLPLVDRRRARRRGRSARGSRGRRARDESRTPDGALPGGDPRPRAVVFRVATRGSGMIEAAARGISKVLLIDDAPEIHALFRAHL